MVGTWTRCRSTRRTERREPAKIAHCILHGSLGSSMRIAHCHIAIPPAAAGKALKLGGGANGAAQGHQTTAPYRKNVAADLWQRLQKEGDNPRGLALAEVAMECTITVGEHVQDCTHWLPQGGARQVCRLPSEFGPSRPRARMKRPRLALPPLSRRRVPRRYPDGRRQPGEQDFAPEVTATSGASHVREPVVKTPAAPQVAVQAMRPGYGAARKAALMGKDKAFADGGGLCSPGRWPPRSWAGAGRARRARRPSPGVLHTGPRREWLREAHLGGVRRQDSGRPHRQDALPGG